MSSHENRWNNELGYYLGTKGGGAFQAFIIFFQILPESAIAPFAHSCKNFMHRSIAPVHASMQYYILYKYSDVTSIMAIWRTQILSHGPQNLDLKIIFRAFMTFNDTARLQQNQNEKFGTSFHALTCFWSYLQSKRNLDIYFYKSRFAVIIFIRKVPLLKMKFRFCFR